MNESKSVIFGCAGPSLTPEEEALFREHKPWGFILFARNIIDAEQVRALTAAFRDCVGRQDAPIFIDQEGGRVQRLRPPLAPNYPAGAELGAIYRRNREKGLRAAWLMSRLHAFDLRKLGITADCLPVLDVPVPGAHNVIGDRAYGTDPETVIAMGRAAADGLLAGGVLPVMKHIPGHGRAGADTHLELPTVQASLDDLRTQDFAPFRALSDLGMAMTAHVVYAAIDSDLPATTSATVIDEIIRGEIGFDGLLMSDDVSMKALSGDFASRTKAILAAGCDVVLHCNGAMGEMLSVISEVPLLAGKSLERAQRALTPVLSVDAADEETLRSEFAGYLQTAA